MKLSRRDFVKLSGFAIGGLSLSSDLSWALPQNVGRRNGSGKRVVILGAGLAGLTAGWELQHAGHDVTILEAQLHPGGRVHTIREGLSDDLYAEAGAGRIPRTHSITLEWVKYFGLELELLLNGGLSVIVFDNLPGRLEHRQNLRSSPCFVQTQTCGKFLRTCSA